VEVVITPDPEAAAEVVADVITRVLASRPAPVLGLATGSSPLAAYRRLIAAHARGDLSFAHSSAVLLDEYVGLPPGHPEAYRAFICRELVDHVDLSPERLFGPDVLAPDLADACRRYDQLIADVGGVDVQLLGIGSDGHVGFNEPGSSLASRTRVKTLTRATRADNARFFEDHGQGCVTEDAGIAGGPRMFKDKGVVLNDDKRQVSAAEAARKTGAGTAVAADDHVASHRELCLGARPATVRVSAEPLPPTERVFHGFYTAKEEGVQAN